MNNLPKKKDKKRKEKKTEKNTKRTQPFAKLKQFSFFDSRFTKRERFTTKVCNVQDTIPSGPKTTVKH